MQRVGELRTVHVIIAGYELSVVRPRRRKKPVLGKGIWFTAPEVVEIQQEEVMPPGPNQVTVRSICNLISTGSELHFYRGEANFETRAGTLFGTMPFPVKFGYQQVGHVESVGTGSAYSVGDAVFCRYPHQDVFTLDEAQVSRIPDGIEPERAAFAGLFRIAMNACITTPPVIGDCVAVSGLGVVGAFAAYIARLTASKLILIDPNPTRRTQSESVGADAVVHPADARDAINELTDGRGVDVFIEASGAPRALQVAIDNTAVEGSISVASWYGDAPVPLVLSPEYHVRRQKLISAGPGWLDHAHRWTPERAITVAYEHLSKLDLKSFIDYLRVPFENAAEAYRILNDPLCEPRAVVLTY